MSGVIFLCKVAIMLTTSTLEAQCMHMCMFVHSTVREVFIVCGLKTTDVFVGEWATFSCQLSGRAPGQVQWWLDGTLLESSPSSEIELSHGHIHTLTLKNLATDDSGTVAFKAGGLTATAKLLVKGINFIKTLLLSSGGLYFYFSNLPNAVFVDYFQSKVVLFPVQCAIGLFDI